MFFSVMSDKESSEDELEQQFAEKEKLLHEINRLQSELSVHMEFLENVVDDFVPWKIEAGELENLHKLASSLRDAVKIFREMHAIITKPSSSGNN